MKLYSRAMLADRSLQRFGSAPVRDRYRHKSKAAATKAATTREGNQDTRLDLLTQALEIHGLEGLSAFKVSGRTVVLSTRARAR